MSFRTKDQNLLRPLFKYDRNQNFLMSKNWRIFLKKMGLVSVLHEKYRFYISNAYPNTKQNHFHNKNDHFTAYFWNRCKYDERCFSWIISMDNAIKNDFLKKNKIHSRL